MHEVSEADDLLLSYNFSNDSSTQCRRRFSLKQVFSVREEERREQKRRDEARREKKRRGEKRKNEKRREDTISFSAK